MIMLNAWINIQIIFAVIKSQGATWSFIKIVKKNGGWGEQETRKVNTNIYHPHVPT